MGTRWQHVSVLKELSKIHVPVSVTPSLLPQLRPQGAGFGMVAPAHSRVGDSQPLIQDGNGLSCLLLGRAMEAFQLLSDRL